MGIFLLRAGDFSWGGGAGGGSGGGGGGGGGGGTTDALNSPTDLYGCALWLPGSGYTAGTWTDSSGNSRNATQATGSKQPGAQASVVEFNAKPTTRFDGVDDTLATASWTALPQPLTLFAAVKYISNAAAGAAFDGIVSGNRATLLSAPGTFDYYAGSSEIAGAAVHGHPTLWVGRFNGASSELYQESVKTATGSPGTHTLTGATLGTLYNGTSNPANIDAAEYVLYSVGLGAYDRLRVENYLAAKYAIPATFDPTSISGLRGWWKADALGLNDGDSVGTWTDSSGNGRDMSQGTAANKPTFKSKGLNGKPYLSFDGSNDYVQHATATPASAITVFAVVQDVAGGTNHLITTGASAETTFFRNSSSEYRVNMPTSGYIGLGGTPANWGVVSYISNAASSKGYFNGTQGVNGSPLGANTAGKFTIGASGGGANPEGMNCTEVLLYDSALTDSQRQQVEGYLANKYGLNAAIRAFDPLAISGCKMWYQVDGGCDVSTDGASIGTLYDRSGNGNHLVQAAAGNKPLYKTARLNATATALFDGVDDFLYQGSSVLTQPEHVFVVAKQVTWTDGDCIFDGGTVSTMLLYQHAGTPRIDMYAGATGPSSTQVAVGAWSVLSLLYNGASSSMYESGVSLATGNPSTSGATGFCLGAQGSTGINAANVEVAEVIVYQGALSTQDRQTLESYLAAKYAISYKRPNHSSISANLAAWYDTSQDAVVADGTAVATWSDRSGAGRTLTTDVGATIAFDAASSGSAPSPAATVTFSHTCTGSNRVLYVFAHCISGDNITGVTYAGTAMTLVAKANRSIFETSYLYYLIAPATGANNVVVSSAADAIMAASASYTGCDQTTQGTPSYALQQDNVSGITASLTTAVDNSWLVGGANSSFQWPAAGAGTTDRVNKTQTHYITLSDSGSVTSPAGADSLNWTTAAGDNMATVACVIRPLASQPTRKAAITNGRPTNRLVRASLHSLSNTGFSALNAKTGATMFVVGRWNATSNDQYMVGFGNVGGSKLNLDVASNVLYSQITPGNYGQVAYTSTAVRVISEVYDGTQSTNATKLRLWLDGVAQTLTFSGTIPTALDSLNGLHVGKDGTSALYLDGDVYEVALFDTALADADRRAVENYLAQKYAISV